MNDPEFSRPDQRYQLMTAHSLSFPPALLTVLRGTSRGARWLCGIPGMVVLQTLLNFPAPVNAAIFKCVSATGDTTYTSIPCADDESTRRISSNAAAVAGLDCRIARKLAFDTTRRMKQGESSESLFDSHGGMDSLSPVVMGLISYIYTFDGNDAVSASRIATLATERCQVGSFGANVRRCEVYPYEFVQQLGGCEAARDEPGSIGNQGRSGPESGSEQGPESGIAPGQIRTLPVAGAEPTLGAAAPASYAAPSPATMSADDSAARAAAQRTADDRSGCRQRLSETLETTNERMENGASTAEQVRLRALQRQLRMQLARC